jgi:hypothetical protein
VTQPSNTQSLKLLAELGLYSTAGISSTICASHAESGRRPRRHLMRASSQQASSLLWGSAAQSGAGCAPHSTWDLLGISHS